MSFSFYSSFHHVNFHIFLVCFLKSFYLTYDILWSNQKNFVRLTPSVHQNDLFINGIHKYTRALLMNLIFLYSFQFVIIIKNIDDKK